MELWNTTDITALRRKDRNTRGEDQVVRERYFLVLNYHFWFVFLWVFWHLDVEVDADVPVDYSTNPVVPLCVQLFWHEFLYIPKEVDRAIRFFLVEPPLLWLTESFHFLQANIHFFLCVVSLVLGNNNDSFSIPIELTSSSPLWWAFFVSSQSVELFLCIYLFILIILPVVLSFSQLSLYICYISLSIFLSSCLLSLELYFLLFRFHAWYLSFAPFFGNFLFSGFGIPSLAYYLHVCVKLHCVVCWIFHVFNLSDRCHCVHLVEFHQAAASSSQPHSWDALIFVNDEFPCFEI